MKRTIVAIAAVATALTFAACSSEPEAQPARSTVTESVTASTVESVEPAADTSTPTTTTSTTTRTSAATSAATSISGEELSAQLAASGNYTEDQILSMTVWQGVACSIRDQLDDVWTVEGIRNDIRENYGFTPTTATARVLRDSC